VPHSSPGLARVGAWRDFLEWALLERAQFHSKQVAYSGRRRQDTALHRMRDRYNLPTKEALIAAATRPLGGFDV
jgi:hypothetical protein